jgi:hypothetical protein
MNYSLIELIANPEKYRGTLVRVAGFLHVGHGPDFQFSQARLHLSVDDADRSLGNSVHVRFGPCRRTTTPKNAMPLSAASDYDNQYVLVEGVFEPAPDGSTEMLVGVLCGIVRMTRLAAGTLDESAVDAGAPNATDAGK